jgi:hypothetical protein
MKSVIIGYFRPVFCYSGKTVYRTTISVNEVMAKLNCLSLGKLEKAVTDELTVLFEKPPSRFVLKPKLPRGLGYSHKWNYAYLAGIISEVDGGIVQIVTTSKPWVIYPIGVMGVACVAILCFVFPLLSKHGGTNYIVIGIVLSIFVLPMIVGLSKAMTLEIQRNFEEIVGLTHAKM